MRTIQIITRCVLMSILAMAPGCALENDTELEDRPAGPEPLTLSNADDAGAQPDEAATSLDEAAEANIAALPVCNWVALYAGGSVPMHTNPDTVDCRLFVGVVGAGVKQLQHSMNRCYGERLTEDGDFGAATQSALRRTQTKAGTLDDGEYGPNTRKAMLHDRIGGGCIRVP